MCLIEDAGSNYCAFFPFILGVVTTGSTIEEIKRNAYEALELHKKGMIEDGFDLPKELKGNYELLFYKMVEV